MTERGVYLGKLFLVIEMCKFFGRGRGIPNPLVEKTLDIYFVTIKMMKGNISFIKRFVSIRQTSKQQWNVSVWRHSYKAYLFRTFPADIAKSNVFSYFMIQLNQAYILVCPEHGIKTTSKTTYLFLISFVLDININFLEQNVTTFSKNYFFCITLAGETLLGNWIFYVETEPDLSFMASRTILPKKCWFFNFHAAFGHSA